MKANIIFRKALIRDVAGIRRMVNEFASNGKMLPLSFNQIYEHLRDFWVIEKNGRIIGCVALKVIWKDLGEVRSLAINQRYQKKGYGRILMANVEKEARTLGLKKIFALTYVPQFFEKMGFQRIPKGKLPHKIWLDCINCPKFPRCDEIAVLKTINKNG